MKLYFVAGEVSGDNHGGELLRALRERDSRLEFFGRGGSKMRAVADGEFRDWIDQAAVVGLWEVLKHYGYFRREFDRAIREVAAIRPDAVVLIDFPGFNLRLARTLREKIPHLKIIYYISPQVWAWNRRRVNAMARSIDLMLCIFPFEPAFYATAGLRALFVGHPMSSAREDKRAGHAGRDNERDRRLVGIFPGSRAREVGKILPVMLGAARRLLRDHPDLHFEIAAASEPLANAIRATVKNQSENFSVQTGQARGLMMRAGVAMIASGTATLEAALSRLPFVLVYRVAWVTYFAARSVVKVRWLGMPNVLANREIVPEFIQHKARPDGIARAVARLLDDGNARAAMLADFEEVSAKLTAGETASNAAEAILEEVETPSNAAVSGGGSKTSSSK